MFDIKPIATQIQQLVIKVKGNEKTWVSAFCQSHLRGSGKT